METEISSTLLDRLHQFKTPHRILVFCLSGLGDTLMFTPALRLLRQTFPRARMVGLTMRQSEYDVLHTNPDFDEVRIWRFLKKDPLSTLSYLFQIRREQFDLSILPCPSNRIHYNVIARLCSAKHRSAFRYLRQSRQNLDYLNNILIPHTDNTHNAEHNLRLVEELTRFKRNMIPEWKPELVLHTLPHDAEEADRFLKSIHLANKPFISLHISSSRAKHMERKCWPKEHFLELIQILHKKHPHIHFLVLCGDEDIQESEWLVQKGGENVHLAKNLPIRTIAEILPKSRLFITNDSGLLHVACAKNVPSIALFGPTNPQRSGPWMGRAEIIRMDLPCSPCFYHTSHELTCPAGLNFECIRKLPVERVVKASLDLLNLPS